MRAGTQLGAAENVMDRALGVAGEIAILVFLLALGATFLVGGARELAKAIDRWRFNRSADDHERRNVLGPALFGTIGVFVGLGATVVVLHYVFNLLWGVA